MKDKDRPLCLHCGKPISSKNCDSSLDVKRVVFSRPEPPKPNQKTDEEQLIERMREKGYSV